jgi:hypothetical protein
MSTHDDELDRFLDGLARGSAADPSGLDEPTARAARMLFQRAAEISPSPGFANRLESTIAGVAQPPTSRSGVAKRHSAHHGGFIGVWFGRALGAAALAGIAMIAMVVVYNSGPDEPNFAVASVAASPGAYPSQAECNRDPVPDYAGRVAITQAFKTPILASIPKISRAVPIPNYAGVMLIPVSSLPSGVEPDAATRSAVNAAVRRDVACRNFSVYGWVDFFGGGNQKATPNPDATPTVRSGQQPAVMPLPVPERLEMTEFADGRVGVLLPNDIEGSGLEAYAIYAPYQSDWFMTEYNLSASDAWVASTYRGAPAARAIVINLEDGYFWPQELAVPADQLVSVTVINKGTKPHSVTSSNGALQATLAPGAETTIDMAASITDIAFTVDIDPASQSPNGGYIWAMDATATPTASPVP